MKQARLTVSGAERLTRPDLVGETVEYKPYPGLEHIAGKTYHNGNLIGELLSLDEQDEEPSLERKP